MAYLSAKVTKLIKELIARLQGFSVSEAKRLHNEGLQLLAVRIVSDPFDEVTKQIKDLIDSSAPTPVVENIAPAPGVANLRQNPLRGAMPSGMRHRPSMAEKCDTRASRVVAAMWRKSKQVERAACDRLLADMGTVLQYRDELSEIGPVLTRLAGRGDGVVMPSVQHFALQQQLASLTATVADHEDAILELERQVASLEPGVQRLDTTMSWMRSSRSYWSVALRRSSANCRGRWRRCSVSLSGTRTLCRIWCISLLRFFEIR